MSSQLVSFVAWYNMYHEVRGSVTHLPHKLLQRKENTVSAVVNTIKAGEWSLGTRLNIWIFKTQVVITKKKNATKKFSVSKREVNMCSCIYARTMSCVRNQRPDPGSDVPLRNRPGACTPLNLHNKSFALGSPLSLRPFGEG